MVQTHQGGTVSRGWVAGVVVTRLVSILLVVVVVKVGLKGGG